MVDLNGWRLGMLICYDVEFPENARQLALAGADLIAAPTANMIPYDVVATTIVPARAFENQVMSPSELLRPRRRDRGLRAELRRLA